MRTWSMILHLYQPPTIDPKIVSSVLVSCYLPLLRLLQAKKDFGLTLNISGSLLLSLKELAANEFFDLVKQLHAEGKIELLNSPLYHPVISLTPWDVIERQIAKNIQITHDLLGSGLGTGFFPPELAVNAKSLLSLENHAEFVVVTNKSVVNIPTVGSYKGLKLIIANHEVSDFLGKYKTRLDVSHLLSYIDGNVSSDKEILITVNDAELFGHHFEERLELLKDLLDSPGIRLIKASEVFRQSDKDLPEVKRIISSSWQITAGFSQWNKNKLQKKYLQLANLARDLYEKNKTKLDERVRENAAEHLDRGWSSCHLYWLSNAPWWHPDLVERGAVNLIRCIRTLPISWEEKSAAEIFYHNFMNDVWLYHWSGKVEKGYKKFDETHKN